jgi:hypothetical protein
VWKVNCVGLAEALEMVSHPASEPWGMPERRTGRLGGWIFSDVTIISKNIHFGNNIDLKWFYLTLQ